ncbi:MAG: type II secretion system F family protein [Planctomycetota bacterium]
MPIYSYKAMDTSQAIQAGVIQCDSPRQAREQLRELGLRVTSLDESTGKQEPGLSFWNRNWNQWVANFTGELATLLSVGVPLMDALETLSSQYQKVEKKNVLRLKDEVSSGLSLAEAMSRQPRVFDPLSIKMVEVGESTGGLDRVLLQLSDFKQKSLSFKDRVISALLYPAVILTVSFGVCVFLMTVVVPMLLENLEDAQRELPLPTIILKACSDFLLGYGWILASLAISVLIGIIVGLQTESGKKIRDQIMLQIPVIGKMSQKQELSRCAMVLATLLKSGIEFVPAIKIAIGTTKNRLLREALSDCTRQIESGKDIGVALKGWSYFPPLVTQIFTVGQKSGRLEKMLFRLASDYDRQVETTSGRLATLIEPVLILILSLFIGFIMFATIMPIMEAGNVL